MRSPTWRGERATGIALVASYVALLVGYFADLLVLVAVSTVVFVVALLSLVKLFGRARRQSGEFDAQAHRLDDAVEVVRVLKDDLRHQELHDSLTGLPNRSLMRDRVDQALKACERSTGLVAVLFCDLDGFKTVNDSLGHRAGDKLLAVVGKRIASVVRSGDTVARLGGDEFAIVMVGLDDTFVALNVAERVVSAVRRPIDVADEAITVSISVGLAFGDAGKSAELLLSEADAAMYAAKTSGRDCVASFEDSMRTAVVRRMALRNAFADGLHGGEFHLVFQPHMSLSDGRLEGFEALARWNHPEFGRIDPEEFIQLAEETGFIIPLGRFILENACLAASSWQNSDPGSPTMSVNVSARQLHNGHFFEDLEAALSYSGLLSTSLILEVTETMLIIDPTDTAKVLSRIRDLGVRVAIDDFGTGYASLSYLRQFPVDTIKVDKSFVGPLNDPSSNANALVSAILRLAEEMGLDTIAEGIENATQRDVLVRLGYTSGQGDFLSPPLERDAAAELVRARFADGVAPTFP